MLDHIVEAMSDYSVVLVPDENTPEWWAGAPSVCRGADGTFYLAARMREGRSPRGRRGYEIRLLKSGDGRRFEPIRRIPREAAGVPGFERPALVRDPKTGTFKLYGCAGLEDGWAVLKFDDVEDPAAFEPASVRPVLRAEYTANGFTHVQGYKDPVLFWDGDRWRLFVIGYDCVERIHHFSSLDGEAWEPAVDKSEGEWRGWQVDTFAPRAARYVRFTGLYNSANSLFQVVEFEVYPTPQRAIRGVSSAARMLCAVGSASPLP